MELFFRPRRFFSLRTINPCWCPILVVVGVTIPIPRLWKRATGENVHECSIYSMAVLDILGAALCFQRRFFVVLSSDAVALHCEGPGPSDGTAVRANITLSAVHPANQPARRRLHYVR